MEQRQLQAMTQVFPTPRLEMDDGNQDLADLHAREDLLLNFYSTSPDLPADAVRIPIDRAMELIVQRGLPTAPQPSTQTLMAGETAPPFRLRSPTDSPAPAMSWTPSRPASRRTSSTAPKASNKTREGIGIRE